MRPARPGDRAAVSSLQQLISEPSPELLDAWPAVGTLLVSVDTADRPVGYLLATGDHVAELAVSPEARREGRATALVDALRARRGDASLTVLVHPDNEAARACYEALGFRRDGRVADAFEDADAIRLVSDPSDQR
ncbi:GNAT family N-acetyltransferase [Haloferax larsenii]|uniref:GNAT family N-acetyltransferase n=1 Tax=Haloferax larsenii TaxID=302484 RepID=A0ABY5RE80_HALLR|nr:GNAT family N-acetyltransferase [Haloferax larsenii]UVE50631.1 GNAT family N-acetyltransferase [Haloferax larsenii]